MRQILKLGLLGAETELPTSSGRVFAGIANEEKTNEGRSSDNTLHVDITGIKKTFTITYSKITKATKDILDTIYNLQLTPAKLSFIYTNEIGVEQQFDVKMDALNYGATSPLDIYYYEGTTINLKEY